MSDQWLPESFGWRHQRTVPMTPEFRVAEDESESGVIKSLALSQAYKRRWSLRYRAATRQAAGYVQSFFGRLGGPAGRFDWVAPEYLPDPDAAPVIDAVSGGNQGVRTCHVQFAWQNGYGRTLPSPRATVAVPSDWILRVTLPAWPPGVTGAVVYATQGAAGSEQEQTVLTQGTRVWTQPNAALLLLTASVATANVAKELLRVKLDGSYELTRAEGTTYELELTLREV